MDQLLGKPFPLLVDPDLKVIKAYGMAHDMGGTTVGNMGYVIIDSAGKVRVQAVDPLFGQHADVILRSLKDLQ